jgi:hypothetical protein
MVWPSIIVAAVIAALITVIFFTVRSNVQLQKEIEYCRTHCDYLEREILVRREECRNLEKQLSYQDGMRVARKTDALYQQILRRCADNRERFTVMMNGTKDGDEK